MCLATMCTVALLRSELTSLEGDVWEPPALALGGSTYWGWWLDEWYDIGKGLHRCRFGFAAQQQAVKCDSCSNW